MGKRSFFPRLALVNLVRNSRYYGPYLLSCGALAAMYYILRSSRRCGAPPTCRS